MLHDIIIISTIQHRWIKTIFNRDNVLPTNNIMFWHYFKF